MAINLISLLNASSSNYNYAPVTETGASRWKIKNDHEMAQIYYNIDEHGSDAESSDLYVFGERLAHS